jgi:HEPN superfamily RiboL-PSP-like protein
MDNLIATTEFFGEALKEIKLLISYSKRNRNDFLRYATFNKSAIVLLCSKFESYLESSLEEYAYLHLKYSSNKNIDAHIYDSVVEEIIESMEIVKNNRTKLKPQLNSLAELCGNAEFSPIDHLSVNAKFSYGKHGQKEVEKLLKRFGFSAFAKREESSHFFKKFNSLNFIRNNIIHEDATPSLTDKDVEKYLDTISNFIVEFDKVAIIKLSKVIKRKKETAYNNV